MNASMLIKAPALAALLVVGAGPAMAGTQSFDVFAQANSTAFDSLDAAPLNTGLAFALGDALAITASGSWNGGGCGSVGPMGTDCFGINGNTGINYFSLIGRVGSGAYFKVGDSYAGMANSSGNLFLAFLDLDSSNNSGYVTALVTVVPEPASVAMLLAGLAVVGAAARRSKGA